MKYYLVVRDPKTKENTDVLQFNSMAEAMRARVPLKQKTGGEVVPVYAKDIKSMFETFSEYKPKNWQDYIKKYEHYKEQHPATKKLPEDFKKKGTTMLHNPILEKKMTVEDVDIDLLSRSLPGNRDFPHEGAEIKVNSASLVIPDLSPLEAEHLPAVFDVQKAYLHEVAGEEIDLVLTFHVRVKNKTIKNDKVEIDYEDSLKDWDYY